MEGEGEGEEKRKKFTLEKLGGRRPAVGELGIARGRGSSALGRENGRGMRRGGGWECMRV
ncbi:hypothetical protein KFK09_004851 [Dendrobium nobile]|uniref:Uncharacterized protein n=1 Tax=Dendrobium nobile TaxID=94219 RepID=A0A8T3BWK2_DENNO|nr:hypothetical protein KFK09_004851 [Dendrobium nobile]